MKKGFTLIEITVVVAIIIILASIFIANYREGEKQFALQRSAHQLAQDLRGVQEMAMAGQEFDNFFPAGGYGIYFEEGLNSYILFADCDGDGKYDESGDASNCDPETADPDNPYPEMIERVYLEDDIMVSSLSSDVGDILEITFFPPDPIVTIIPPATSASIELSFNDFPLTVTINKAGLIDIR